MLQESKQDGLNLPFSLFTFDDYRLAILCSPLKIFLSSEVKSCKMFLVNRWAVSSVMTRQNQVPAESGRQVLALVPLWDMCNHTEGEVDAPNNFIHSSIY